MSQQIQISGGAKVRSLEGVITGTSGVLSSVPLGAANGVATLDSGGKVPVSQLPSSVVTYLGTWNAATNTPTLVNGTGDAGDMYICNVQGTVNFGAGPVVFVVGDWVLYGSGTWQKSSGQNGTVTSVAASITGNAVGLTGSPITTAGTLAFAFSGTSGQYVNGAGNLTTFPTLITSIGLSMPSAFSVANSPLTANGTIAVTGAGTTAQYIRGDGSLATFPTIATEAQRLITEVYNETGATLTKGTVVYINGGHGNLPTITKAIATGDATSAQTYGIVQTDITDNNNGYVVVIGSLGDLDTQAYANGTQLYLSSTTAGAWTSTKQYAPAHLVYVAIVTRSHPTQGVVEVRIQNGFEMDELHNVSAQSPLNNQGLFYNTSTSLWENKSIATALGYTPANDALVVHNTGNETIGGTKTFSDATKNNGGILLQNASSSSLAGYMNIGGLTNGVKFTSGGGVSNTFTLPSATGYTFTFPSATGTLALTSDIPSITGLVPYTGATGDVNLGLYSLTSNAIKVIGDNSTYGGTLSIKQSNVTNLIGVGYTELFGKTNRLGISFGAGSIAYLSNSTLTAERTYTLPDATGTLALTSDLAAYVPITRTLTGLGSISVSGSGDLSANRTISIAQSSVSSDGYLSATNFNTFNNKQNALTLTTTGTSGAATLVGATLNIPQYQSVLTNPVTGTGFTNYLPKFTGASTIGNSAITDDGTTVTLVSRALNGTSATFSGTSFITDGSTFRTRLRADAARIDFVNYAQSAFVGGFIEALTLNLNTLTNNPITTGTGTFTLGGALNGTTASFTAQLGITGDIEAIKLKAGTSTGYSYLRFYNSANVARAYLGLFNSGGVDYVTLDGSGYKLELSGSPIVLNNNSYNVLIGTASDSGYKLDVNGTGRFSGITTFGSTGGSGLRVYGGSGTNQWDVYLNSTNLRFSDNTGTGSIVFDRPLSGTSATFSSSVGIATSTGTSLTYSLAPSGWNGAKHRFSVPTSGDASILSFNWDGSARDYAGYGSSVIGLSDGTITFGIGSGANPTTRLTIASTGAATFSSSVTATNYFASSTESFRTYNDNGYISFFNSANTTRQGYIQVQSTAMTLAAEGGGAFMAFTTAGSERMRITSGGNVLIGTTDDGGRLVSYSTTAATQIKAAGTAPAITFSNTVLSPTYGGVLGTCTSANQFLTGTSAGDMVLANQFSGYRVYVASYSGGVYLTSGATSWTANSDIRLKNINSHIENAVEKLSTLQTINFSYKDDKTNKQNLGLIAQEVEKIFPELIDKNGDGMLGVRYTELVPVLIKAIQEQQKEINELKLKIK